MPRCMGHVGIIVNREEEEEEKSKTHDSDYVDSPGQRVVW